MAAIEELLQLFAQSIFAKAKALKRLELSPNQRKRLGRSITDDIRTCGGVIFPDVIPPAVSKAAHQEAERIGLNICAKAWHDQTAFDKGRKTFHWEHVNPVSSIQKMCEGADSEGTILDILKQRLRIAWILKREDLELRRLGYRSNRPDPEGAYRDAKIDFMRFQGDTPR